MTEEFCRQILAELADIKARLPAVAAEPNRSLTRKDAAAYLGLHEKTLASLTTAASEPGKVTGYKSGARWKYRLADLDRYRDAQAPEAKTGARSGRAIDWGQ